MLKDTKDKLQQIEKTITFLTQEEGDPSWIY